MINNKLSFNDSFQFPSFSLDSLVKNLNKYDEVKKLMTKNMTMFLRFGANLK